MRPLKPFFGSRRDSDACFPVFMPDVREAGGGDWTRTNILLAQNQAPDLSATPQRGFRKKYTPTFFGFDLH